jgi:uncharacterized membrane protein YfcA
VLAGTASSSGAIGSLISYPALLVVGLAPVTANVTNAVAVTAVGLAAALGSRTELQRVPRHLAVRWSLLAAAGGVGGAALLLLTSDSAFEWAVPFLVLIAVAMLLAQPRVRELRPAGRALFPYGLVVTAGYEGYFGAGAGVMTLALVLLTIERSLPHANAVKNALLGVADASAGIVFIAAGSVAWAAFAPLTVGYLGGGLIGPVVARRARPAVLRAVVACFGVVLAAVLLARVIGGH